MYKIFYPIFLSVLLSGCTTNGFIFRSFGNYEKAEANPVYTIGTPYQIGGVSYTPKEDYSYSEIGIAGWYTAKPNHITANGEVYNPDELTASHKTLPLPSIVKITNLENHESVVVRVNERGPLVNNRLIDVSQKAAEELGFELSKTTLVRVEILPQESQALKAELPAVEPEKAVVSTPAPVETNELKPLYEPDESLKPIYKPTDTPEEATITNELQPIEEETTVENIPPVTPSSGYYVQHGAFKNQENALKLKTEMDTVQPTVIYEKKTDTGVLYRVRSGPFENRENALSALDKFSAEGYGNSQIIYEQ